MRITTSALFAALCLSMPLSLGATMVSVPVAHAEVLSKNVAEDTNKETITASFDTGTNVLTIDGAGTMAENSLPRFLYNYQSNMNRDTVVRFVNTPGAIKFPADSSSLFYAHILGIYKTAIPFTIEGLENVDVSGVKYFNNVFGGARIVKGIENWDTSNAVSFNRMFRGVEEIPDISRFNTSKVTDMYAIFFRSKANPDVSGWDVSTVTDFGYAFEETPNANPDVSRWDVSSGTNFAGMFKNATAANPDVYNWDMSKATDVSEMFTNASSAKGDISHWQLSDRATITTNWLEGSQMVYRNVAKSFMDLTNDLYKGKATATLLPSEKLVYVLGTGYIDPAKLSAALQSFGLTDPDNTVSFNRGLKFSPDMSGAFDGWQGKIVNLSNVDRSELTNTTAMFKDIGATTLDIEHWAMSDVVTTDSMFEGATKLNVDLSAWKLKSVTSMNRMFANTPAMTADLSCWIVADQKTDWLLNSGITYNPDAPKCKPAPDPNEQPKPGEQPKPDDQKPD
ncbi:MAG: BspA family leucine-rich repeat surface protein, partial [Corynebacterium sp.]|nr:BspA family leucine-rich repeat surface protein [Corynebacterium sp.]